MLKAILVIIIWSSGRNGYGSKKKISGTKLLI